MLRGLWVDLDGNFVVYLIWGRGLLRISTKQHTEYEYGLYVYLYVCGGGMQVVMLRLTSADAFVECFHLCFELRHPQPLLILY